MFVSNSKFYIKSTISSTQAAWTTFLLSPDFELWQNLETWTDTVSMVLKSGTQIERFEITATGGTATIVKRWITQAWTDSVSVWLQKQWTDGTIAYVTALAFDIFDKQGDTMTWPLEFSWTTNPWVTVNNVTTAQRNALVASDGTIVYDTSLQEFYSYKNGAWTPLGTGSGGGAIWSKDSTEDATLTWAINGSNTVFTLSTTPGSINSTFVYYNGQLMERTQDYNLSWTTLTFTFAPTSGKIVVIYPDVAPWVDTASTRATTNANALNGELYRSTDDSQSLYYKDNGGDTVKLLDVTTNQLKVNVTWYTAKTSLVDADQVLISDSAASNVDKKITYGNIKTQLTTDLPVSTSNLGFAKMATNGAVITGTDQTTYINPYQSQLLTLGLTNTIVSWTWTTLSSLPTERDWTEQIYTERKAVTLNRWGTYKVSYDYSAPSNQSCNFRIYKNGVAFWTEKSSATNAWANWSEDLVFSAWDRCSLYMKSNVPWQVAWVRNFLVQYSLVTTYNITSTTEIDA